MRVAMIRPDWLLEGADEYWKIWPEIEPFLERACAYSDGRFSPESVRQGVVNRTLQLWVAFVPPEEVIAVAVTHLATFPTGRKVAEIVLVGGRDRAMWMGEQSIIEKWAKAEGCQALSCLGRKGWKADLHDWKVTAWSYEKEI